jgi:hypothetical protein
MKELLIALVVILIICIFKAVSWKKDKAAKKSAGKTPKQDDFTKAPYTIRCVISIDSKDNAVKITFKSFDSLNKTDADNLKIKWMSLADELETYLNTQTTQW